MQPNCSQIRDLPNMRYAKGFNTSKRKHKKADFSWQRYLVENLLRDLIPHSPRLHLLQFAHECFSSWYLDGNNQTALCQLGIKTSNPLFFWQHDLISLDGLPSSGTVLDRRELFNFTSVQLLPLEPALGNFPLESSEWIRHQWSFHKAGEWGWTHLLHHSLERLSTLWANPVRCRTLEISLDLLVENVESVTEQSHNFRQPDTWSPDLSRTTSYSTPGDKYTQHSFTF